MKSTFKFVLLCRQNYFGNYSLVHNYDKIILQNYIMTKYINWFCYIRQVEQSASSEFFLSDLFCISAVPSDNQDELDSYISSTETGPDVLGYWRGKEDMWPKLSMCARWILSAPATSTSSERVFSSAGRTLDDCRSQLSPETVDNLLFLHGLPELRKQ